LMDRAGRASAGRLVLIDRHPRPRTIVCPPDIAWLMVETSPRLR
jgi:hypothetical protein